MLSNFEDSVPGFIPVFRGSRGLRSNYLQAFATSWNEKNAPRTVQNMYGYTLEGKINWSVWAHWVPPKVELL